MYYRTIKTTAGVYLSTRGERFHLSECRFCLANGKLNEGWTEFPSLEAALTAWGLVYSPPEDVATS